MKKNHGQPQVTTQKLHVIYTVFQVPYDRHYKIDLIKLGN